MELGVEEVEGRIGKRESALGILCFWIMGISS